MRILVVAMAQSVHTVRWLQLLEQTGWDIHLFPVDYNELSPELRNITLHDTVYGRPDFLDSSVRAVNRTWPIIPSGWPLTAKRPLAALGRRAVRRFAPQWEDTAWRLARAIREIQPDLVHSHEICRVGKLVAGARTHLQGQMPPWIVSNWGSDLYLFGQVPSYQETIREVMSACNYYTCECRRDVLLAQKFGFQGEVLGIIPNAGGYDLPKVRKLRNAIPPSRRKRIMLKGYQNFAGRALAGLRALELCADALREYTIALYSISPDVEIAAHVLAHSSGLKFDFLSHASHEEILRQHNSARLSIGLSISDAISTSVLDAMVMGAFPIQSYTSCACEDGWFTNGETGIMVHPNSPEETAAAIRRALADDALVDQAAETNICAIERRLDRVDIQKQVIALYERALSASTS